MFKESSLAFRPRFWNKLTRCFQQQKKKQNSLFAISFLSSSFLRSFVKKEKNLLSACLHFPRTVPKLTASKGRWLGCARNVCHEPFLIEVDSRDKFAVVSKMRSLGWGQIFSPQTSAEFFSKVMCSMPLEIGHQTQVCWNQLGAQWRLPVWAWKSEEWLSQLGMCLMAAAVFEIELTAVRKQCFNEMKKFQSFENIRV